MGSSKKTTWGSSSSARARATRWRRPLESEPHVSDARPDMFTASSAVRMRWGPPGGVAAAGTGPGLARERGEVTVLK